MILRVSQHLFISIGSYNEDKIDSKKAEILKTSILYMIQILNKVVVNGLFDIRIEDIKDAYAFYMHFLFGLQQAEGEIINLKHMGFKSLNAMFSVEGGQGDKMVHFSNL